MNRNNLLLLGIGQCGNIFVESIKRYNPIYSTAYINSSYSDVMNLKNAMEGNTFIFNGADGSGRNRELANQFAINDEVRLAMFFRGFKHFKTMVIFTSMGGGTGSGSVKHVIETIKKVLPDTIINLVCVIPAITEGEVQLKNTLACVEDISYLMECRLINDLKYIDNNKGESLTEINKKAVIMFNKEFDMTGISAKYGNIDSSDLNNVINAYGYGAIMELPDETISLDDALMLARARSVFVLPDKMNCSYAAINVTDRYNIEEIRSSIRAEHTIYASQNKTNKTDKPSAEKNLIALGGCEPPLEPFYRIEQELTEREKNKITTNKSFKFKSDFAHQEQNNTFKSSQEVKPAGGYAKDSVEELKELFDVSDFDFDLD